jgi:glucose-6-phosphate 1-dehydrogenase
MAESFGVQGRGISYKEVGAICDVGQNYLLQIRVLLAMDPPASRKSVGIGDERIRMMPAMRPLDRVVVRDQFKDYCKEPGVSSHSQVETFAAIKFYLDNWR